MAEDKKTFAQWLGRTWELYQLAKDLSTQRDLDAAEQWNAAAPERRQEFLDWINKVGNTVGNVLFAGHKQEREIKEQFANATGEEITNIINNFSTDFSSGKETVRPQEEEAIEASPDATEDTTYFETEVRDRKPKPGTTQEIVARAPIGELKGDAFDRYITGVVENDLTPEQAYANATGQELPGFLTDENGDILFEEVDGSFVPIPVEVQPQSLFMTDFVNHIRKQGPDVINYLKDILVRKGIADEGDFDDSGEIDINLQGYIEVLMAQSDYDNAGLMFGSNEYMDLIDTIPDSYNWVEDSNMNVEKVSWALLNRAINRYSEREKLLMNVDVKAKEKEYEIEKDIPTEAYMSRRIDALFQEELDRPPTEEERNKYLNSWNSRYDNYAQNLAYAYKAAKYGADMENYLIENGKSIDMTGAMGGDYRDTIGTREIGTRTLDDDDIREETLYEIETDLRTEKDLIEAGQNRRKHQSNIIGVMTGKI